jgi:DEAD/DEAH box helicase domain-containing protein
VDGRRDALAIDDEDLRDLGLADPPLVFQSPATFQANALVTALRGKYPDHIRAVHELPARSAVFDTGAVLHRLHPGLQRAVRERLLPGGNLYAFQAQAVDAALTGNDVVVTTPTASGKSLTYTLPVLDTLLRNPHATALYLSPLVALTEDQLETLSRVDDSGTDWVRKGERFSIHRVCRTLDTGAGTVTIARYDGQVLSGDRTTIRERRPQYVLTTPDMLHAAILAGAFNERQWRYLLAGLRYVVIDELHTYRGVLGASFANLLRRLQRLCRLHGADPRFLCASATMIDPAETVEQFIGRRPIVVDGSDTGAPQHKRAVVLWSGGTSDETRVALSTQAKNVLLQLVAERVRSIAFARSISEINDIYRFTSAELREQGLGVPVISPFMRELLPEEKRGIIRDLKQGRLHGVISTTALAMGIDIGSLSTSVIIGFPGSIAQFWQQAGRAGRAGEGVVVLIADDNPLDQFFVQHPHVLFDLRAEPVYCNPNNPYIVRSHLVRAAREAPLTAEDVALFGPTAAEQVHHLREEGLLTEDDTGRLTLTEAGTEQANTSFRSLAFSVPVMAEERRMIVEVDAARAQRALHRHAHYQHIDRYYRVVSCDLDWRRGRGEVIVQELEHPEYTTTARVESEVTIRERRARREASRYVAESGIVECHTRVSGYYQVPLYTRSGPFVYRPLGRAAPEPLIYQTQALWLSPAPELLSAHPPDEHAAGMYSLAGALRLATAVEELCDPSDIEGLGIMRHSDTGLPLLMVYDTVPGGVGIAEAAYEHCDRLLSRARQILEECPYCAKTPTSRGCPRCVTAQYGDESTINRQVALEVLRTMLL